MAGGRGHGPQLFGNCLISEMLFHQKIFRLLLLVKIKVLNFIGKSLKIALPNLQVPWGLCYYPHLGSILALDEEVFSLSSNLCI